MVQIENKVVPPDKDVNNPHNNIKIILRFKFRKVGRLQYISHLDLVRTMNKIVVRSGLPLYYTEGFNPKPKMVFAAPLSIGTESYAEYMDLRLKDRVDPALAMKLLNRNMTDEMQAVECYYPDSKFTDMKWLSYSIKIHTVGASAELASECERTLTAERLEILKSTKSGEKLVDIRPLVRSASVVFDSGALNISCILSADQSSFLNPEYIVSALKEKCGILNDPDLTAEHYTVTRLSAFTEDMSPFR
ncbi:MAG: DUF2344 domain-containing protein [Clostridia bacterium]|nr:DUF2344 domain-containing protein [Clostridia bacterium]